MKYTSNEFLKLTGIGVTGAATTGVVSKFTGDYADKDKMQFNLALTSYTFRSFSLDDTIKMTLRQNILANNSLLYSDIFFINTFQAGPLNTWFAVEKFSWFKAKDTLSKLFR